MNGVSAMLRVFPILFGLCLAAYGFYALLSVWAARKWRRTHRPYSPHWTPGVTILKPVRGIDAEAYANFASFCRQDYPADRYQLLFGVLDPDDPAIALVRRLQAEFPAVAIALICPDPDTKDAKTATQAKEAKQGANLKVCNLLAMLPSARHDLLILCDSDMRVDPDYVRRVVAPFEASAALVLPNDAPPNASLPPPSSHPVGLVTCPYRGFQAQSLPAILEALGIGADFIPSSLVSRALEGVGFAFGSTIALPRLVLEQIGGFEALRDELADDFRLGNGARNAGYEVVLSDYVVDDVLGKERFGAMWARRLRWARTVRACRPGGYAGAFITYGTALGLLFWAAMGFSTNGALTLMGIVALRMLTAVTISLTCTRDPNILRFLPLLPLSDLFSFALYVASFCGNRIVWRGETFRLLPGGKIARLP